MAWFATNIGFINFHRAFQQRGLARRMHDVANVARHMPGRFVGNAQHSRELQSTHAFLRGTEQVEGLDLLRQRQVRVFEDRADSNSELPAAGFTLIETRTCRFSLNSSTLALLAMGTDHTIRPAEAFKHLAGLMLG